MLSPVARISPCTAIKVRKERLPARHKKLEGARVSVVPANREDRPSPGGVVRVVEKFNRKAAGAESGVGDYITIAV